MLPGELAARTQKHFAVISSEDWGDPHKPCPNVLAAAAAGKKVKGPILHVLIMGTYTANPPVDCLSLDMCQWKITFAAQSLVQEQVIKKKSSTKTEMANELQHHVRVFKAQKMHDDLSKQNKAQDAKKKAEEEEDDNRPLLGDQWESGDD